MSDVSPREVGDRAVAADMPAVVADRYGPPGCVGVKVVRRPVIGDTDVLVRVHAASICRGDIHLLEGRPYLIRVAGFGLRRPKHRIPGQCLSGEVVATGKDVRDLRPRDQVYGEIPFGAFAEYASGSAHLLAPKPANLTHEEAAAVPCSALTALQGLRDVGGLQPGQSVLINGASGGVGTYAVQIAKYMGGNVTAVCRKRHSALMRELGADRVIDYTKDDFARSAGLHDILLDLVGNRSLHDCRGILKPHGILIAAAPRGDWIGPVTWMLKLAVANAAHRQRHKLFVARPNREDLIALKDMIEGDAMRPVVERRYPLREAAAALAHVAAGHAQGTTVIQMGNPRA